MSKILFLLLLVVGIYWWMRRKRAASQSSSKPKSAEDMIRCVHCGLHLPRSEAVGTDPAWFCSEVHQHEYRDK